MAPPTLLGFNNNVRHRGRIFHIQTEDSGLQHPRIVTHLFADGGRIIKTSRTDYAEHLGRADTVKIVQKLMKEQHKGMFIALRAGELDALLDQVSGLELEPPSPSGRAMALDPLPASSSTVPVQSSSASLRKASAAPASRGSGVPAVNPTDVEPANGDVTSVRKRSGSSSIPADADDGQSPAAPGRYAPSRPAAIFSEPLPQRGLFGDSMISEKSLDEVILSYLADDLDGTDQR